MSEKKIARLKADLLFRQMASLATSTLEKHDISFKTKLDSVLNIGDSLFPNLDISVLVLLRERRTYQRGCQHCIASFMCDPA